MTVKGPWPLPCQLRELAQLPSACSPTGVTGLSLDCSPAQGITTRAALELPLVREALSCASIPCLSCSARRHHDDIVMRGQERFSPGCDRQAGSLASGTRTHVPLQPREATWTSSNGPGANGCPWIEETCSCAAEGGHLDLLKWATAEGCEVDSWTFNVAAEGGHLEVLDTLSGRSQCT